ncbi:MAG: HD domain-containing protein [Bacteroidales bacterium]|nr:HD domain-containing protein [Bacteroidales bacterium]
MEAKELTYYEKRAIVTKRFNDFIKSSDKIQSKESIIKIKKAFELADDAHIEQSRKTGLELPYITHPIAVAKITTGEMGFGTTTAVAALLHDVVEDSNGKYTVEDIENKFGHDVAVIVDGVTKIIEGFNPKSTIQVETFKKFINNMAIDKRTAYVKIADRLHNLRTFAGIRENSQMIKTAEAYDIYAPLAHLLGLFEIKKEIEDLSFMYRQPVEYNKTKNKAKKLRPERKKYYNEITEKLKKYLPKNKFKFRIEITERSLYRAWRVTKLKKISFNEIHNFNSIRVIIEPMKTYSEKQQCYTVYSYLTDIFPVRQFTFKDWITNPKSNGFQALIADIMYKGRWAEVQIMTERMNKVAKVGYASGYENPHIENIYRWVNSIKDIIENKDLSNEEVMELIRPQDREIYALTPKGKIIKLPKDATALDFAFRIHSDFGIHFQSAEVNGKLVGHNYKLNNADQVKIRYSDSIEPQNEWLNVLACPQSKNVLRHYLKKQKRKTTNIGENIYENISTKFKVTEKELYKLIIKFNCADNKEFYFRVANETITEKEIISFLKSNRGVFSRVTGIWTNDKQNKVDIIKFSAKENFILKNFVNISLAKCCRPVDGDSSIIYRKKNNEFIIHRSDCVQAKKLNASDGKNTAKITWNLIQEIQFRTTIKFNGVDNKGLLSEIIDLISNEHKINMTSLSIKTEKSTFNGTIDLMVSNADTLYNVLKQIRKIKYIKKAFRVSDSILG